MKIGVVLDGRRTAAQVAELARLAEARGFSHVWLSGGARTKDHFVRLAVAAAATSRIRLGPVAVSPFEMHPAQIALSLLTLEEVAPGRATLVLGAGGDLAKTLGPPRHGRVEAVAECVDALRASVTSIDAGHDEQIILVDLYRAATALGLLTGVITREEIFDEIFSKFCIGK